MRTVLIAGASTRAAAESAARAGFAVTTVDGYADRDQHPGVRALSTRRDYGVPFTASTAARLSRDLDADAVSYLSSFENHPAAVATLARGRALWGNPPAVLRAVRSPFALAAALQARGSAVPRLRKNDLNDPDWPTTHRGTEAPRTSGSVEWLIKPLRSGGGHRVRAWRAGTRIARGEYLQERVDGRPASIVFVAANGRMVPLGVSVQIAGDAAFGASGYRYCGSLMGPAALLFGRRDVLDRAIELADAVAEEFGLVGVNGIDFIARNDQALPIEVNPRWSSSMELVERLTGRSVFAAHAAACADGALPAPIDVPPRISGKAIVYARGTALMGDTRGWLEDPGVGDVPHAGERIEQGQPICTVFAEADDVPTCRALLTQRAGRIDADVERWQREAA